MARFFASWFVCGVIGSFGTAAWSAGIYFAEKPDGTPSFASHPQDGSYLPYAKVIEIPTMDADGLLKRPPVSKPSSKREVALKPLIEELAKRHDVDAALVLALIDVESGFTATARSPKGAMGLMQLMPETAQRYGAKDLHDPAQNIEAGIRYLKDLLNQHHGNVALALASYNAGERTVVRYGRRIPPYKETMLYVPAVLSRMQANLNSSAP